MQRAEVILSLLGRKAESDENFIFRRLYRNLFNPDFYLNAWTRIQERLEQKPSGLPNCSMDRMKPDWEQVIRQMKAGTYHPKPLFKKQERCDEDFAFRDRLILEILRQILEAIYEPHFLETSHGFRPQRNHLTALHTIRTSCQGTNWVIKGEIKDILHRMDSQLLISLLARRIDDGRFLDLLNRFIRAGYLKSGEISTDVPASFRREDIRFLLVNIYLHELDRFMKNRSLSTMDARTPMNYLRYAGRFLICISGGKVLAQSIRNDIQTFLQSTLHLDLTGDDIRITHLAKKGVRFLGYEIRSEKPIPRQSPSDCGKRSAFGNIQLLVPGEVIRQKIRPFIKKGRPVHINSRIHLSLPDLIHRYHEEMRELYNFYCLAEDVSAKLGKFRYYHYWSLVRTIARKEKSSVKKVLDKYGTDIKGIQGTGTKKRIGVKVQAGDGKEKVITYFHAPLKKRVHPNPVFPPPC